MAKLTDKQWLEIKALYECGHGVTELSKRFGTPKSTLQSRVKKENWQQGEIAQAVVENANALSTMQNNSHKIAQNRTDTEVRTINDEILALAQLKTTAYTAQQDMMETISLITRQAKEAIENNPSGFHVKSQTDTGVTYGRNTEFIKDLAPIMNPVNQILGIGKPDAPLVQNNIQNNNTATAEISADPENVKRILADEISKLKGEIIE